MFCWPGAWQRECQRASGRGHGCQYLPSQVSLALTTSDHCTSFYLAFLPLASVRTSHSAPLSPSPLPITLFPSPRRLTTVHDSALPSPLSNCSSPLSCVPCHCSCLPLSSPMSPPHFSYYLHSPVSSSSPHLSPIASPILLLTFSTHLSPHLSSCYLPLPISSSPLSPQRTKNGKQCPTQYVCL